MFKTPNAYRVRKGQFASSDADGCNGAFFIPNNTQPVKQRHVPLKVIASDGEGWEHVSVSLPNRTPTWEEMDYLKNVFWDESDCVMQLHPPRADWVNNHPHCLHLWRPTGVPIPAPPAWLVGYRDMGELGVVA
jgi:hypothetical protein